ncbi:MAG TPA: hypothetical protein VEI02_16345, partial [Planctomycetota bacterium]|nr:hypothetical protein [Planctomycetota bacterium]
ACMCPRGVAGPDGWFGRDLYGEVAVVASIVIGEDPERANPFAVVAGRGDVRWDYPVGSSWPALVLTAGGTAEVVVEKMPLVVGRVVGADGAAIDGAEVVVTAALPPPFGDVRVGGATCGADGGFQCQVNRDGRTLGIERFPPLRLTVVHGERSAAATLPPRVRGEHDVGVLRLSNRIGDVAEHAGPRHFGGDAPPSRWCERQAPEFAWAAELDAKLRSPHRQDEAPDTLSVDEKHPAGVDVVVSSYAADGEPVSADVTLRRGERSARRLACDAAIRVLPGPLEIEARRGAVVARRCVEVREAARFSLTLPPTRVVHLADDDANPEDFLASTTATVDGAHLSTWSTDVWPGVCISTDAPVDAPVTFVVDRLGDRCTVTAPPGVDVVEAPKRPFGRLHVKVDAFAYARRLLLAVARADDPERSARTFGDFEIHAGACAPWTPIALAPGRYLVAMLDVTWLMRGGPGSDCGGLIAVREVVVRDGETVEAAF